MHCFQNTMGVVYSDPLCSIMNSPLLLHLFQPLTYIQIMSCGAYCICIVLYCNHNLGAILVTTITSLYDLIHFSIYNNNTKSHICRFRCMNNTSYQNHSDLPMIKWYVYISVSLRLECLCI